MYPLGVVRWAFQAHGTIHSASPGAFDIDFVEGLYNNVWGNDDFTPLNADLFLVLPIANNSFGAWKM